MSERVAETLIDSSVGDVLRATTEDGEEYLLHLVDAVQRNPDYQYGAGGVWVSAELDTEEHEVPTDKLPTESAWLRANQTSTGRWEDMSLTVWDPVVEDGLIVDEEERTLGTVEDLTVEERHE